MSKYIDTKILGTLCIAVVLAVALFYGVPYLQSIYAPSIPHVYKYNTGLTVRFKIYSSANYSLLTTGVLPYFYAAGIDPSSYTFSGTPVSAASYYYAGGVWEATLDEGTYVLCIKDIAASPKLYPVVTTVTVPGTDSDTLIVVLSPAQINMDTRATIADASPALPCYPYNVTGTYAPVASMNTTKSSTKNQTGYWYITYQFSVSGTSKIAKNGRIYWNQITNFIITKAYVDGVLTPVGVDTTYAGGLGGYFITFSADWTPGIHYVTVYVQAATAMTSTPISFTATIADDYAVLNPTLAWWQPSYTTKTLSVTK